MSANKNIFYEQQLLAIKLADVFSENVRKTLNSPKKFKSVFPSTEKIYDKQIVINCDPSLKKTAKKYNSEDNNYNNKNNYYNNEHSKIKKRYADDFNYNYEYNSSNDYNDYYYDDRKENNEYEYILVRDNKRSIYNNKKNHTHKTVKNNRNIGAKTKLQAVDIKSSIKLEDDSNSCVIKDNQTCSNESQSADSSEKKEILCYDKNIEYNQIKSAEKSTSSQSDYGKNENYSDSHNNCNPVKESRNIYRRRENSRFGFVNNSFQLKSQNESEILLDSSIPEYVSNIIYKKISSYTFFKKFTCMKDKKKDILYFENELNRNNDDSWVQFLKSNVTIDEN